MKKALVVLAVVLFASAALAQGKFATEFRGMIFGKDLSEFTHMKSVRKQGDLEFYTRYGDERTFQGVPVENLTYGFYKNKFCMALFTAKGPSSYSALKSYLDGAYGPPSQPKVNIKQFTYTAGEVTIELGYDDTRKVVEVSYAFRPIVRMMMPGK